MSTQNIGFYEDLTKIIFQLSSNTHLISSSVKLLTLLIAGTDLVLRRLDETFKLRSNLYMTDVKM